MVAIFLLVALVLMPQSLSPNHRGFSVPWGKTWKNESKITSSVCYHYVNRKDFVGFEDLLGLCRLRKNIFVLNYHKAKYKKKTIPRTVSRHLAQWSILDDDHP